MILMNRISVLLSTLCFLGSCIVPAYAEFRLIDCDELLEHELKYQVIYSSDNFKGFYRIPGSLVMNWVDFRKRQMSFKEKIFGIDNGLVLDSITEISDKLTKLGIDSSRPILIVGDGGGWGEEARLTWNFLFWGTEQVFLYDGGKKMMDQCRYKKKIKSSFGGKFKAKLDFRRRVTTEGISHLIHTHKLILDLRSLEEYDGRKIYGQNGERIPTSKHLDHQQLYDRDGRFITKDKLKAIFPEITSVKATYCAGGVRSALAVLLIEAYFQIIVPNYDGSIWEWQKRDYR